MSEVDTQEVVQGIDDRYFLVRDEQRRFYISYKSEDGEFHTRSATFKDIDYVPGMELLVGTDVETGAVGIMDIHGEELVPAVFQTIVICRDKIVLVDYNNKPRNIDIEQGKNVKEALLRFSKKMKLKDVFIMGKVVGNREVQPYYRRNMREAIISEEKRWGFEEEGDAE